MTTIDPLRDRNRRFAETGAHVGATIYPQQDAYVITCLDPRVDPAAFLQLELGDAAVVRNAGGRVTDEVLSDLAYISHLSANRLKPEGPLFEVAVIHHNQCGTHFLADPAFRQEVTAAIGTDDATVAAMAVTDPERTVRIDVARVRASAVLSDRLTVSGHVYDVTTGILTTIVPAVAIGTGDA